MLPISSKNSFSRFQQRNKQNNLSFRNIAQNKQPNITQNKQPNTKKSFENNKKSFKAIKFEDQIRDSLCFNNIDDYENSFHNNQSVCMNHPNKFGEYYEHVSKYRYCKLCATKLASLGHKIQSLQVSGQYKTSQVSIKTTSTKSPYNEVINQSPFQNSIPTRQQKPLNLNKFSRILTHHKNVEQKQKYQQNLYADYQQAQKSVDWQINQYQKAMDQVEELIHDIRIRDIQYFNRIKATNQTNYQKALHTQYNHDNQTLGYDLFGKSLVSKILPQTKYQNSLFNQDLSHQKTDQARSIYYQIQSIIQNHQRQDRKDGLKTNMALIKSINSNESQPKTKQQMILKNSSSISNLSNKSNFRKQKISIQPYDNQTSRISCIQQKAQIKPTIQNFEKQSRFSSNSVICRKRNNTNSQIMKTQSSLQKKRHDDISLDDDNSCQDTPQSIKSKISSNSFILPRNAAVQMFQKINICQSIDINSTPNQQVEINNNHIQSKKLQSQVQQSRSSNLDKSNNKSVKSKDRKSFNRYQTFQWDE